MGFNSAFKGLKRSNKKSVIFTRFTMTIIRTYLLIHFNKKIIFVKRYLKLILTNDGRYTCEIKCRIAMAKAAFNKKRTLFSSTLDLELRKKLVKCYIWSIALYGGETWTLRAVDQKHLESFEMWCLRKKLVKCYIWSIALYGVETWTLWAVDQKHLESFEM